MSPLPPITLEKVRGDWCACYDSDRLAALYPVPRTWVEVVSLQEGRWRDVPDVDRVWTLTRPGFLPDSLLRLFAVRCARRVLLPDADHRVLAAVETAERRAYGAATDAELREACSSSLAAMALSGPWSEHEAWKAVASACLANPSDAAFESACDSRGAAWHAVRQRNPGDLGEAWVTTERETWGFCLRLLAFLIDYWEQHGCIPPREEKEESR